MTTKARLRSLGIGFWAAFVYASGAAAHPGSGIAVGEDGTVYFTHTAVAIKAAKPDGTLEVLDGPGWHFLICDPEASFAKQKWPRFPDGEVRVTGANPALMRASSFPIAIGPDGAVFYPHPSDDGTVRIMRTLPQGDPAEYATLPPIIETGPEGEPIEAPWIHGLAAGRDGSLYYTEQNAIRRIDPSGKNVAVVTDLSVPGCTRPPAFSDGREVAFLRGLDVTDDGTIYAAASGCSATIKVTPDGTVSVALRAEPPWAPTGIAVSGSSVYVLEFAYIDVEQAKDWLPRVRKLDGDGTVTTIATVTGDGN